VTVRWNWGGSLYTFGQGDADLNGVGQYLDEVSVQVDVDWKPGSEDLTMQATANTSLATNCGTDDNPIASLYVRVVCTFTDPVRNITFPLTATAPVRGHNDPKATIVFG
jgi:hypothetical protein